jgi:hypothetical protein
MQESHWKPCLGESASDYWIQPSIAAEIFGQTFSRRQILLEDGTIDLNVFSTTSGLIMLRLAAITRTAYDEIQVEDLAAYAWESLPSWA